MTFQGSQLIVEALELACFACHVSAVSFSGGLRGLQTGSESIRRISVWSSHKKRDQGTFLLGSEACKPQVKTSDVFLCGLQPKIIPRNPVCELRGLEAGSESIRRVSVRSSPKVIPRDPFLRAIAEILRKRLRRLRGWSERMSEFGSQEVLGEPASECAVTK